MKVPYNEVAQLTRGDRPDVYAGRTDSPKYPCPDCNDENDMAFLSPADSELPSIIYWCPCGCVYVVDKGKITNVFNFFTQA